MRPNTRSRALQGIVKAQAEARSKLPTHRRAKPEILQRGNRPPTRLTGERLLTPSEIEAALNDRVLEPLSVLPLSAILKQLREHVEAEGGITAFARASGSTHSVISDALRGARGGIGTKAAAYLGLRPTIVRLMAYRVVEPRKFYRHRPSLI